MKLLSLAILSVFLISKSTVWETDLEMAKQKAKQDHKFILLNFSGSDWCIPCIRLHKDLFESSVFSEYAESNLVLLNADFPRLKKNQLTKAQQKKNDALADRYNSEGTFPLTLLLDANGNLVRKWEGNPALSPEQFVSQIKSFSNAAN